MKIFNWMRRRFNDDKGRSAENVTQNGDEINDINNDHISDDHNKCLLNDHQINDQWIGGYLLSIGTFGFDPLKHSYNPNQNPKECPNHYNVLHKDIEKDKEMDEINQEFYDDELRQQGKREEGSMNRPIVAIVPPLIDHDHHFGEDQTAALIRINKMDGGDDDDDGDDGDEIMMIMEKKERITLADLFNAESAGMLTEKAGPSPPLLPPLPPLYRLVNKEAKPLELMSKIETSTIHPLEGKELKKKKLTSKSAKQISQPIQKVQKLVIKMLKRKIYPDIEARIKANNVSLQQTPGITSEVGA